MKTFVWKVFSHRLYDNFLIKFSKGENCHTLFLWVFSLTDLLYQCNKQRTKQTVCLFVCCTCFSLTASFVATTVCRLIVLLALRDVPTLLITILDKPHHQIQILVSISFWFCQFWSTNTESPLSWSPSWTSFIIRFLFRFDFKAGATVFVKLNHGTKYQQILSPHSADHHPGQACSSRRQILVLLLLLILKRVQDCECICQTQPNINKLEV